MIDYAGEPLAHIAIVVIGDVDLEDRKLDSPPVIFKAFGDLVSARVVGDVVCDDSEQIKSLIPDERTVRYL